jgi:tRNA A37 threonylcarbamoyladenosine synthetase subunit TsaC/SUA5/YrdC
MHAVNILVNLIANILVNLIAKLLLVKFWPGANTFTVYDQGQPKPYTHTYRM